MPDPREDEEVAGPRAKAGWLRSLAGRLTGRSAWVVTGPAAREGAPAPLLGQLARLDEVRDRLDEIQNSIEQHATGRMQRERELSQRLDRILAALLLLLDYLEEAEAGRHAGCDIGWVRTRLTSILRDVDIDELPVQIGQPFQSDLHRLAGQRPDPSPPGSVLEVTRNGYWRRAGSERAVVRAAEVIVSSGSVRVGGEGTGQEVSSHG